VYALAALDTNLFAGINSYFSRGCLFVSTDNGAHWHPIWDGLSPYCDVGAIAICASYATIFTDDTHDSIWRRPLSEMIGSSTVEKSATPIKQTAQVFPNPSSQSTTIA